MRDPRSQAVTPFFQPRLLFLSHDRSVPYRRSPYMSTSHTLTYSQDIGSPLPSHESHKRSRCLLMADPTYQHFSANRQRL